MKIIDNRKPDAVDFSQIAIGQFFQRGVDGDGLFLKTVDGTVVIKPVEHKSASPRGFRAGFADGSRVIPVQIESVTIV